MAVSNDTSTPAGSDWQGVDLPWSTADDDPRSAAAEAIVAAIHDIEDPELPHVTIGDLGIVRAVQVTGTGEVNVRLTPTYTGCPATEQIRDDVRGAHPGGGVRTERIARYEPGMEHGLDHAPRSGTSATSRDCSPATGRRTGCDVRRSTGRLPALQLASHAADLALRGHRLQGDVRVQRLFRTVRVVQGAVMSLPTEPQPTDQLEPVIDDGFRPLRVTAVDHDTDDSVIVTFDRGDRRLRFEHGQHLTLRRDVRRRRTPPQLLDLLACARRPVADRDPPRAGRRVLDVGVDRTARRRHDRCAPADRPLHPPDRPLRRPHLCRPRRRQWHHAGPVDRVDDPRRRAAVASVARVRQSHEFVDDAARRAAGHARPLPRPALDRVRIHPRRSGRAICSAVGPTEPVSKPGSRPGCCRPMPNTPSCAARSR